MLVGCLEGRRVGLRVGGLEGAVVGAGVGAVGVAVQEGDLEILKEEIQRREGGGRLRGEEGSERAR